MVVFLPGQSRTLILDKTCLPKEVFRRETLHPRGTPSFGPVTGTLNRQVFARLDPTTDRVPVYPSPVARTYLMMSLLSIFVTVQNNNVTSDWRRPLSSRGHRSRNRSLFLAMDRWIVHGRDQPGYVVCANQRQNRKRFTSDDVVVYRSADPCQTPTPIRIAPMPETTAKWRARNIYEGQYCVYIPRVLLLIKIIISTDFPKRSMQR